jgi:hypothetical protein
MRYEKPVVVDLKAIAAGTKPDSCFPGINPITGAQYCQPGTGVAFDMDDSCNLGPNPGAGGPTACIPGGVVTGGLCQLGTGGGALFDTCTTGPAPA